MRLVGSSHMATQCTGGLRCGFCWQRNISQSPALGAPAASGSAPHVFHMMYSRPSRYRNWPTFSSPPPAETPEHLAHDSEASTTGPAFAPPCPLRLGLGGARPDGRGKEVGVAAEGQALGPPLLGPVPALPLPTLHWGQGGLAAGPVKGCGGLPLVRGTHRGPPAPP